MYSIKLIHIVICMFGLFACREAEQDIPVRTGLDQIENYQQIFANKRVGIIANHTARNQSGIFITDVFSQIPGLEIKALFGPEHGFSGTSANGSLIKDSTDIHFEIPIYSLYGKIRKPTPEMLKDIDILIFDIQDVGTRYYTYISTMSLAMEAAVENGVEFIVLDRPNPINGVTVEGNLLEPEYASFVGLHPVPVRHGMTAGELAGMIDGEGWLTNGIKANPTVITLKGWERKMWFDETGLTWRPPSPNIPTLAVAIAYPGMCLFEGTNLSEGRGTYSPFLRIGAPWFNLDTFSRINQIINLNGVHFGPIDFTPISIPSMSPSPKHQDRVCYGISINVSDRDIYNSYLTGIALVKYLYEAGKDQFSWRESHFDRLCGTAKIRKYILEGRPLEEIERWIAGDVELFREKRQSYLLY